MGDAARDERADDGADPRELGGAPSERADVFERRQDGGDFGQRGGRLGHTLDDVQIGRGLPRDRDRRRQGGLLGAARIGGFALLDDEHVVGREHAGHGDADGALEAARIADGARGDGVRDGLGRRDHEGRAAGLGIAGADGQLARRGGVHLARHGAAIGLDDARAGGGEIGQRPGGGQDLEHLARGRRDEEIDARGEALGLEQLRRGEHVAQRDPRVAAEHDLVDRLSREIADGADLPRLVEQERIDRPEIDRDGVVARRALVGEERAVGLRAALVAQVALGLLVGQEDTGLCAEERSHAREDRALGDVEETRAGAGELEDDGRLVLRLDLPDDFVDAAAEELEGDVASADEGSCPAREQDLDAARRT